jgi:hypothetical protein
MIMRHARFILSCAGLTFASLVLGISLLNGSTVQSAGTGLDATDKELYLSDQMLPDHVAYPVLMAVDRAKLEIADPLERIYGQAEYANRRLEYAQALLEKDKPALALTTLTKAEKYLIHATEEAIDTEAPATVKKYVYKTVQFHTAEITTMAPHFSDADRAVIDQMLQSNQFLLNKLSTTTRTTTPQ